MKTFFLITWVLSLILAISYFYLFDIFLMSLGVHILSLVGFSICIIRDNNEDFDDQECEDDEEEYEEEEPEPEQSPKQIIVKLDTVCPHCGAPMKDETCGYCGCKSAIYKTISA